MAILRPCSKVALSNIRSARLLLDISVLLFCIYETSLIGIAGEGRAIRGRDIVTISGLFGLGFWRIYFSERGPYGGKRLVGDMKT